MAISKKTYSFIFPFLGNRAIVQQKSKYGVIDEKENLIVPLQYDTISFYYPYFDCIKNKKTIRLDLNGKVIKLTYGECGGVTSTFRIFWTYKKNDKIGLLDFRKSNPPDSLPNIYDELYEYNAGVAFARIGKKWGTINSLGNIITDFTLDSVKIMEFSDRDKYKITKYFTKTGIGFINGSGKVITRPDYQESYFTDGELTLVRTTDNRLVYIDCNGRKFYK